MMKVFSRFSIPPRIIFFNIKVKNLLLSHQDNRKKSTFLSPDVCTVDSEHVVESSDVRFYLSGVYDRSTDG